MSVFSDISSRIGKLKAKLLRLWMYCSKDVWSDPSHSFRTRLIKTLNLSVTAFFNGDIQTKACAMAFRSLLAIVPALALILAIGKGFGLQDVLREELILTLPSQETLLNYALDFVDSYLSLSSEGLFLGIGVVLLLWTLISLLGSVEKAFNDIWGVKSGRSYWRKITDYLAIFLILPILMICASGLNIFVTTIMETVLPERYATPMMSFMLDCASLILLWLFFTGVYIMIPTAKVRFRNALGAGIFAGTGFLILQWLFLTGQIYVSRYNAIYGSFAFLPLFLIWLQLVWVICLMGGVICYASQNIFRFNFSEEISHISLDYRLKITVSVMAVIVRNFLERQTTLSEAEISERYDLPPRLVTTTINRLIEAGLVNRVVRDTHVEVYSYAPAIDPSGLTVGEVIRRIRTTGSSDFIPGFESRFASVVDTMNETERKIADDARDILVRDFVFEEDSKQK